MVKQKVVVFGATGALGTEVAKALLAAGHSVTAVVRDASPSDAGKAAKLDALKAAGSAVHAADVGSLPLADATELLKAHTALVSILGGQDLGPVQLKLVEAAKAAGTITRFIPSEFGIEVGQLSSIPEALQGLFGPKLEVREALRASGVPYTFPVTHGFSEYWVVGLGQLGLQAPPETAEVYGSGDKTALVTSLADIGAIVAKAIDDPKAENKLLDIWGDEVTQDQLIKAWEAASGSSVGRKAVSGADLDAAIKGALEKQDFVPALITALIKIFWVDDLLVDGKAADNAVRASDLYPDFKFESAKEFLAKVAAGRAAK